MAIGIETTQHLAKNYYEAVENKDLSKIANLLHADVSLIGPLSNAEGKESVLRAVAGFTSLLRSLHVKFCAGSEEHAMVNYEAEFGDPFGIVRSAALISSKDNVIVRIELFFDPRPFTDNGLTSSPGTSRT